MLSPATIDPPRGTLTEKMERLRVWKKSERRSKNFRRSTRCDQLIVSMGLPHQKLTNAPVNQCLGDGSPDGDHQSGRELLLQFQQGDGRFAQCRKTAGRPHSVGRKAGILTENGGLEKESGQRHHGTIPLFRQCGPTLSGFGATGSAWGRKEEMVNSSQPSDPCQNGTRFRPHTPQESTYRWSFSNFQPISRATR